MNDYFDRILQFTGGLAIGTIIIGVLLIILIISMIVHYFDLCKNVEIIKNQLNKIANQKERIVSEEVRHIKANKEM